MTLIEILVVMAIIAILIALLVSGVMAVWGRGYEAQNRTDILNLSVALDRFKADHKFYPPSQLKLHASLGQFGNSQLDIQSITFISRMWPQLGNFVNIPWAGKGVAIPAAGFILEGDQVLVFALGGPPQLPAPFTLPMAAGNVNQTGIPALMGGFSTNPVDPIDINNVLKNSSRKKYFDFDQGRLFFRDAASPFPSYRDAYPEQGAARPPSPFVFFSSNNVANGYDTENYVTLKMPVNAFYGLSPYIVPPTVANASTVYYRAETFQIISAGLNGKFGTGGVWPPLLPPPANVMNGGDDLTNFSGAQLGANVAN
jgi:prepilin-type N-terminal cleavage/methylation domain-containing protein